MTELTKTTNSRIQETTTTAKARRKKMEKKTLRTRARREKRERAREISTNSKPHFLPKKNCGNRGLEFEMSGIVRVQVATSFYE